VSVREFDASNDYATFTLGSINPDWNSGAFGWTFLALAKPLAVPQSANRPIISVSRTNNLTMGSIYVPNAGTNLYYGDDEPGADFAAGVGLTTDWQLLAMTKPAGTQPMRGHRLRIDSGGWTHADANAGANHGTDADDIDEVVFARFAEGIGGAGNYRIAVAALWNTDLSDAEIESIGTAKSTVSILDLAPAAGWEWNQASTATAVTDFTGGGSTQASLQETTVINGDDPPGWTFGTDSVIVGGAGGMARPGRERGRAPRREGAWW
jgi:hypothetical protein